MVGLHHASRHGTQSWLRIGLEDYLPLLLEASGSCYVFIPKRNSALLSKQKPPRRFVRKLKGLETRLTLSFWAREEDTVGSWTGGNVDVVGHSWGSNPKRDPGAHNFATKQCDRPAVLPAVSNVLVFCIRVVCKKEWSLSKLCWCTHQIIKTGSYQTGSVSSFQVTYLMRPPQFTSRWVRRAGWEIKYFDASFFSSSSSAGPVAPVGNWLETSDPATRQLKCQSSSLIVTDPAFSRAWMDKENADFRRVQQTRQNPTTLALPLVELLFLLVFIPQFLTCSLPGEGKTWLGVLPMKWMGFVMLWLVSD